MLKLFVCFLLLIPGMAWAAIDFARNDAAPGNMRFTWIHGSLSAKANTDPRIQVHQYNQHTFILRQNPAVHWEAPFMYLLMGNSKAVLLDAGATAEAEYFPLRDVVDSTLQRWEQVHGQSLELMILPLGADASQTAALAQFEGRPKTTIVAPHSAARLDLFQSESLDGAVIDLGGRVLSVIGTPGLDAEAISLYDPWNDMLFTGNAFYPGRLVIRDFPAYVASVKKLVDVARSEPVAWLAGGRIEMTNRAGMDYILRSNYRPNERVLQLDPSALGDAYNLLRLINGQTDIRIHSDFILMHGVGRGARDYGWPVYIPEQFQSTNTR